MKTCIVLSVLLAVAAARIEPHLGFGSIENLETRSDINNDIQDFINLFPLKDIFTLVEQWIKNDAEVGKDWAWITSDAQEARVFGIEASAEFMAVRKLLEKVNMNVKMFGDKVHKLLGYAPMKSMGARRGGLAGLLDALFPKIPIGAIKKLAIKKFIFSSAFRSFVKMIKSTEFQNAATALGQSALIKETLQEAQNAGIDFAAIKEFVEKIKANAYFDEELYDIEA